jgi:uncharacterized protein
MERGVPASRTKCDRYPAANPFAKPAAARHKNSQIVSQSCPSELVGAVINTRIIVPPFNESSAKGKVQLAEDAWNTRDPERVVLAYTEDTEWRNRTEFLHGREQVKEFLKRKWQKELDYRLKKELWGFRENRMAVRFEYEWHDAEGQWFRSYGNELWEFADNGLMRRRYASINDAPILEEERRIPP